MSKPTTTTEKVSVLYVDDEPNNLFSFKALLRMDYKIFTAQDTNAAYEILKANPNIHVVISDQNMPGENGVDFFERVCTDFPFPVRMLLTGYADMEAVVNAINKGRVFRYITKPWNDFDLTTAIQEADQYYISNSLLKMKNEELQLAYEELDRFSYSVTHDIRGPIVSALSALDVLQNIDDTKEIRRFLAMLEKSMKRLNSFIMNTHSYHRISRGGLDLGSINFQALTDSIREVYDVEEEVRGSLLKTQISQDGEFVSDEILISLIINNLLSNAFKYAKPDSPDHTVTLDIAVKDNEAVIKVQDNGIGIAQENIDKIFELFYRSEDVRMSMGSGFGLYNVNRAILKLGGTITVKSEPGVGTTFEVIIKGTKADAPC